jgi:hypothetical protein
MTKNHGRCPGYRWFQISLRFIFLLMVLVSGLLAWYRHAIRQIEQAQQAERDARVAAQIALAEAKRSEEERTSHLHRVLAELLQEERQRLQAERQNMETVWEELLLETRCPEKAP